MRIQIRLKSIITTFYYKLYYLLFEKPKGLDFIREFKLSPSNPNVGYVYVTPPERTIRQIFNGYKILPNDAVLDIGCGKGFPLYLFTELGFNYAHGIELSQELCSIAMKNITVLKLKKKITIECADAATYENLDDYTFIYMFNPFPAPIMKKVVSNIENSLKRKKRNLTIIYTNPSCHLILNESKYLEFYEKRLVIARLRKMCIHYYRYNWS